MRWQGAAFVLVAGLWVGACGSEDAQGSRETNAVTAPDLSLKSGGAAVDQGEKLAKLNDAFAGSAPDLGGEVT